VFVSSITKYNDSENKSLDEYGIKAKDGGLRCGEIIIQIVSVISKIWLVLIKLFYLERHLQIAGTS